MRVVERELGRYSHGVWTTAMTDGLGVPAGVARQRRAQGLWQRVHRGVYADGGVQLDAVQRGWAAVLAGGPGATAARRTAARMWSLPLVDDDDPATGHDEHRYDDVACPRPLADRPLLHPVRLQLERGETCGVGGCPVTTPLRTLWDLTRVLRPEALVCALDDALRRGLVSHGELQAYAERRTGHAGVGRFRWAAAQADGRAESPLETLGRLLTPAVPLVPQVAVRGPALLARIDLADEQHRFGVEADGRAGHAGEQLVRRDRDRERWLVRSGWVLERYGWYDVRRRPAALRERVQQSWQQHLARHGPGPGAGTSPGVWTRP